MSRRSKVINLYRTVSVILACIIIKYYRRFSGPLFINDVALGILCPVDFFLSTDVSATITGAIIKGLIETSELKKKSTGQNMFLHLGKDWPKGYEIFRSRVHYAFMSNKDETDPVKVAELIRHGRYVCKEIEALYKLKKYRAMKNRYY